MTDYIQRLNAFLNHLEKSKDEMLDIIADNGDYEDRFNIKLAINGKLITIPLCADSYSRLEQFINEEIKEELEIEG